jgi:N-ethylmaleimide reductase
VTTTSNDIHADSAFAPQLTTPLDLGGGLVLPSRVVMAPMTRLRAASDGTPTGLMARYYAQRASAGLIISESTSVSRQGNGYDGAPGIYTGRHVDGWRAVTDAVHAAGGRIAIQLFHAGRISHPDFHEGALPVAPSAIAAGPAEASYDTVHPFVMPRALETEEIAGVVEQYRNAARLARDAGFDAVEVHGANGYLLDQFLQSGSNRRTDGYGGTVEGRVRLLREVVEAVADVWSPSRVGVRLSPCSTFNGMADDAPEETFAAAAKALDVAYLHIIEPGVSGPESGSEGPAKGPMGSGWFRFHYPGLLISAGGHTADSGRGLAGARGRRPHRLRQAVHRQSRSPGAAADGHSAGGPRHR